LKNQITIFLIDEMSKLWSILAKLIRHFPESQLKSFKVER